MKTKNLNQKGFSHFESIVLIVVLVLISAVGTFVYSRMHKSHAGSQYFHAPYAMTTDSLGHVWVANLLGNSVTELNAKDGSFVNVYSNYNYEFNYPYAITTDNLGHVWVANYLGNSVTELNAQDGSLVQIVK